VNFGPSEKEREKQMAKIVKKKRKAKAAGRPKVKRTLSKRAGSARRKSAAGRATGRRTATRRKAA